MNRDKVRLTIVWSAAIIAFLTGIALAIAGFYVPPEGEIDGSVLTIVGEFLTFFGSVFGIGEYARVQMAKIKSVEQETEEKFKMKE